MTRADDLWMRLVELVMSTRDDWRRATAAATGLSFGRVRVLRRLADGPRTLVELADATGSDAPAVTVAVNDLERRGLVARRPHPTNRRAKLVSLTPKGRALAVRANRITERAPAALAAASRSDLAALGRILASLES